MSPSSLNVRSQSAAAAGIPGLLLRRRYCVGYVDRSVAPLLPHSQERPMVIIKPAIAIVDAVAGGDIGVRHLLERRKVVFVVRVEDRSGIVNRRVIEFFVVLGKLTMRKVNVRNKMVFGRVRIFVINVLKAVFESLKLVKKLFKRY
ncbi:predicted protein [Pyrenophora tritici-repentis Pt-1C-BFP]|uniref:Uncharacterized protein n=1 Tax=Pyrenophora tritici-repentis (strain Pt-1C-BFP) TaxID=426418 RepID=B2WQ79_PYRTR|nr:uncharacterized protein PTRG_12139 [Pyrenophora tritici-repentis Pt-1C-BFP]EDU47332.1 predicted protein [Pyrenophora tritici-repentis Pt-1C-BFP]